jgi:integral membrane protein
MPLKYWAEIPGPNKLVGYAHGVLFIAFIFLTLLVGFKHKWSIKKLLVFGIASLLPFATFYVEEKYLRTEETT